VALHRQAVANGDPVLADLIFLGAYTGARVESLCVLKDSDVNTTDWSFKILSDKTKAGRRIVPIHTELRPVIQRLMDATKDGYLLPGLKEDKWGDRSSNIRARFGALKTAMGFGEQHVEVFERAKHRIYVGIIADIVAEIGHWRRIDRRNPNCVHSQPLKIVEPVQYAF
jgi:integrase